MASLTLSIRLATTGYVLAYIFCRYQVSSITRYGTVLKMHAFFSSLLLLPTILNKVLPIRQCSNNNNHEFMVVGR